MLLLWAARPPPRGVSSKRAGSPVDGRALVSRFSSTKSSPRALTGIKVKHHDTTVCLGVLIDSGADESLMDWDFVSKLNLKTEQLSQPIEASALDGSVIFRVTHKTEPLTVIIGDHQELMCFYLYSSNQHSLILGFPWLKEHNPHIDWSTGRVLNWAESCNNKCLRSCHDFNVKTAFNAVSINCDTDSETPDLTSVPRCYHDLGEVFTKSKATSLLTDPMIVPLT